MANFSFGFIEGSFLLLNGQKHLRSVAEDLISNEQKELNEFLKNSGGHGHYKTLKPIFLDMS